MGHLNLTLLTVGLLIAVAVFAWFMRKERNRNAGDRMPERGEDGGIDKARGVPLTAEEVRRSETTAR